jgi:phosphoglycerol transferase MdoB-like AlkP superfamily enzyme
MNGSEEVVADYSTTQKASLSLLVYALAALFQLLGRVLKDESLIQWLFPPIGLLLLFFAATSHHLSVMDHGKVMAIRF